MLCSERAVITITDDDLTMSKTQDRNKTQDKIQATVPSWELWSLVNTALILRKGAQLAIKKCNNILRYFFLFIVYKKHLLIWRHITFVLYL